MSPAWEHISVHIHIVKEVAYMYVCVTGTLKNFALITACSKDNCFPVPLPLAQGVFILLCPPPFWLVPASFSITVLSKTQPVPTTVLTKPLPVFPSLFFPNPCLFSHHCSLV